MARRFHPGKTRRLLQERNISIRSVAVRMAGTPEKMEQERNTIRMWLRGKHVPKAESVERLAAAIPSTVEEITEEEPAPEKTKRFFRLRDRQDQRAAA